MGDSLIEKRDRTEASGNLPGALLMVAGTAAAAGLDVVAKALSGRYPVIQLMWFRYVIHMLIVAAIFGPQLKTGLLATGLLRIQLARSALLVSTSAFFFLAVRYLPVAETTAILYVAPLVTVVLANKVLDERTGKWDAFAAAIGFVGVVAVIQPFSGRFGMAVLLPLGAALTSSFYLMLTRLIGWRDSAPTTWFYSGVVGLVVSSGAIGFFWVDPTSAGDLALLILLGVLGAAGHLMFIKAHQRSPAPSLAPLGYLELGFVALMGLALFEEFPNLLSTIGMALIAAAGVLVARLGDSSSHESVEV